MRDSLSKSNKEIENKIEALLFVSPTSISVNQLATLMNLKIKIVELAIKNLEISYKSSGLRLQENKGRYQLTTSPEFSDLIEEYLGLEENTTLSQAALEALAIVAYKQPITRPEVDEIRGVNSDGVMRNLLNKGLIQELGRAEGLGRAILYGTTSEFLQFFGISTLKELPPIELIPETNNREQKVLKD